MFPVAMVIMIPLGILALLSIPYFAIYPDRHMNIWDEDATDRQKELLARWRAGHRRLTFFGRIRRASKLYWRRRKLSASYCPASMRNFKSLQEGKRK
jgi:hypothetical protein